MRRRTTLDASPSSIPATHSLRRRLPLLIATLLCLVVVGLCWFAYRELERVLVVAATDRLNASTGQVARMFGDAGRRMVRNGRTLASDPAIVGLLDRGGHGTATRAKTLLDSAARRSPPIHALAVVDTAGHIVLSAATELHGDSTPASEPVPVDGEHAGDPAIAMPRDSGVGPLFNERGELLYRVVSPIFGATGTPIGSIVEVHRFTTTGAEDIKALIGAGAELRFGNADGSLWTDLHRQVRGPAGVDPMPGLPYDARNDAGDRVVGLALPVIGGPWMVLVQLPRAEILAPARDIVLRIGAIALVAIALGGIGAWVVSRQVTTPLGEVSRAAVDVAGGDYTRRVRVQGRDELASLAVAFNTMAAGVEAAAADLRDSELRYRRLVEFAPYGMLVHDGTRVLYANPAAASLLGAAEPAQLVDRRVLDFVHPASYTQAAERVAHNVVDGVATPRAEIRLQRVDGQFIDVETVGIPFTYRGQPAAQVVLRDVGEHKRLEEQFRQAQKMEAVGRLAGGVAHDFNNLLTVITSYSAMMIGDAAATAGMRADLLEISRAAERAAALTRQLLAFSRQQVMQPRVLDLNAVAHDMRRLLTRLVREDVRLTESLASELGPVFADAGQVEQVIMNLVVNARDAMPRGGTIHIETVNVTLDGRDAALPDDVVPGPYVMLAVVDTGIGMDAATQARIFEPFFTTKRVGEGTGLGLATVYGIVKQSGGHVTVTSERGVGTTFRVYLPHASGAEASPAVIGGTFADEDGAARILLVEDDPAVRSATRRMLQMKGHRVLEAPNGADALARLGIDPHGIDLLLTDAVMPGMNGAELVQRARQIRPTLRVLMMSGYADEPLAPLGRDLADVAYLQKPFTPDELAERVRLALETAA